MRPRLPLAEQVGEEAGAKPGQDPKQRSFYFQNKNTCQMKCEQNNVSSASLPVLTFLRCAEPCLIVTVTSDLIPFSLQKCSLIEARRGEDGVHCALIRHF